MIISTWNINSIKVRLPAVLQYLDEFSPDVLVLQETKSTDDNFPVDDIVNYGYSVVFYGQKTYNGVAIISKTKPSFVEYNPVKTSANEARSITAVSLEDDVRTQLATISCDVSVSLSVMDR